MALHRLNILVVVASVLVEGGLSWRHVPEIPAGRRAQYYLLKGDGGYKYGYDTGTGIYHKATSGSSDQLTGGHSYQNSPDAYGHHGGAHEAQSQGAGLTSWSASSGHSGQEGWSGSAAEEQSSGDASYNFQYSTGDQSRQEVSDAQGNIQGNYAYTRPDGLQHSVQYEAGAGKGFIVKGGSVSQSAVNTFGSGQSSKNYAYNNAQTYTAPSNAPGPDGSYSFSYNVGDHSRSESSDSQGNVRGSYSFVAKDDGVTRTVNYEAGAEKGFVAEGAHLPKADVPTTSSYASQQNSFASNQNIANGQQLLAYNHGASGQSYAGQSGYTVQTTYASQPSYTQHTGQNSVNDGSYSFAYQASDHSRKESADANGNVQGSFSFTPKDDGVQRTVIYEAGAEKGFVASGAHLPTAPSVTGHSSYSSSSSQWQPNNFGSTGQTAVHTGYHQGVNQDLTSPSTHNQQINPDGSYSFSYSANDHSRQESGDSSGNVQGAFSFVAKDDGLTRTVGYEAGANKGFIARGDHLPTNTPVASQSYSSGLSSYAASSHTGSIPTHHTVASTYSQNVGTGGHSGVSTVSQPSPDGSYSFAYQANDHSRKESQDASGNVKGSYSFVAKDDGLTRKVDYEAGAEKGFIAYGNHLPVPVSPVAHSQNANHQGASHISNDHHSTSGDSSYTFSYNTGDSSRTETSDSQGNVRGSFSYVSPPDGSTKTVNYEAGAEKGFLAEGAHLPKEPLVGQPLVGQPLVGQSLVGQTLVGQALVQSGEAVHSKIESDGNRAYTYSYSSGSSSKHETSDAGGNVMGSYSYLDANGVTRTVNYSANDKDGFIIKDGAQGVNAKWSSSQPHTHSHSDSQSHTSSGKSSHRNRAHSYVLPEGGKVHTYLYPNRRNKYGYIYDTKA